MALVGDERAQSVQVGAVLLFGVLIILLSTYQAFVVPNQNQEIEFNHNQQVHSQLQDLRNTIVALPGATSTQAISVSLGTRYPSRVLAQNPGPPAGSLRTNGTETDANNITIRHASASGEVGDFWTGSAPRKFDTGAVVYSPNYNVYDTAPTTYYEHSVAYNQFRSGNITLSEQAVVDGRQITLVALNGSMSRSSSGTTAVDVRPVSRSSQTITVTNDTATTNVSVSLLTRLPESIWKTELLAEEIDSSPGNGDDDRYVADVSATNGPGPFYNLTITFERGVDYQLRLAKGGVGTGVEDESAAYLTDISGDGNSITRGDSTEIVLEVRDAYNNPNQSTTVQGSVVGSNNGRLEPIQQVSDSDGRVRFRYETFASNNTGTHQLNFSYQGLDASFDGSTPENVSMNVTVRSASTGGGPSGGSAYTVAWMSPTNDNSGSIFPDCSDSNCTWDVGKDSDSILTLRSNTTEEVEGATLDFAVNNSTVGTVSPGENTTDSSGETLTDLTANENGTIAIYTASGGSSDVINLTVENLTAGGGGTDTTAPSISNVALNEDGSGNVAFTFDSDESLASVTVTVDGPSTTDVYSFSLSDFSESGSGPYTYTLTTSQAYDDGDGTYTATVDDATDSAGNNGGENGDGSGLSDSYDYTSGGSANLVYTGDGNTQTGSINSDASFEFVVRNDGSSRATISEISVTTSGDFSQISQYYVDGNNNEVRISSDSDGYADAGGIPNSGSGNPSPGDSDTYATGQTVTVGENTGSGPAETDPGSTATISLGEFRDDNGATQSLAGIQSSSQANAELTVTLTVDGNSVSFYFNDGG